MRIVAVVGIVLVVLGMVSLVFHGVPYSRKESVLNFGPVHASVEERKTLPLDPAFGAVLLGCGMILLLAAWKQHG